MTKYGKSPWIDGYPASRVPAYPKQRGPLKTAIVVIGGGLTGCATAYAFAAAGVDVVLIEADRVGQGTSALSSGWMSGDPGVTFADLERAVGARPARHGFQAWRRAALDFATLLRRLDIKCALHPAGTATVAMSPEQAVRLKKDHKTRRDAGLDAPLLNAAAIRAGFGLDAGHAIRDTSTSLIDPYRASLGLADAAVKRGARVFERTTARRVAFGRKTADVFTSGGSIRAERIVVATGVPTLLFKSLQRHFWFRSSYLTLTERVPAKVRQTLGARASVLRDSAEPTHIIRWVDDERMLVAGADAETPLPRLRDRVAVQRTGQLMYELSTIYPDISGIQPAYGWEAPYARSGDGLPYFGPHRNFPHHLFAFGDASRGVTGAYLASRILLRYYLDEVEPADAPFAFTRNER
jgi:glycine/D-amino acid oxidase-like deaminating enzyme